MISRTVPGLVLAALAAAACGSDGGGGGGGDIDAAPDVVDAAVDAAVPQGFTRLVGRSWSLPPGASDTYRCVRLTLPTAVTVSEIMAQSPLGTHHTVLSIASGSSAGADGEFNCSAGDLGMVMLYASGVGTSPLVFPAGVGMTIPAGTQIHLNLHLFNTTDNVLSGETQILVKAPVTPPTQMAENVFAGSFNIVVPPGATRTVVGGCTVNRAYKIFALWPHMHQIATHQKIELIRNGTPMVLHDAPFAFYEQNYFLQDPEIDVQPGDRLQVSCTYENTTSSTVTFGDSSNQEMCFAGLYRYPASGGGNIFECTGG
ncbi:MAG: hypothetical protein R3B06_19330 [Kofleriaceae bacterium]